MGCEICGSTTKNPESASHINSKKHQDALKALESTSDSTPTAETTEVSEEPASKQSESVKKAEKKKKEKKEKPKKVKKERPPKEPKSVVGKPTEEEDWLMLVMFKVFIGLTIATIFTFLGSYLALSSRFVMFVSFIICLGLILLYYFYYRDNLIEPMYYGLSAVSAFFVGSFVQEVNLFSISNGFYAVFYGFSLSLIVFSLAYIQLFFNNDRHTPFTKFLPFLGIVIAIALMFVGTSGDPETIITGGMFSVIIVLYIWFILGQMNEVSEVVPSTAVFEIYTTLLSPIEYLVNLTRPKADTKE